MRLYQLPISHYCEKVRWALDHKGLDYEVRNLLPGLHASAARKLTGQTALPILVHDGRVVHDSTAIIDYLDEHFPQHPLTPTDPALRRDALEWEEYADEQVGDHVRRLCYQTLLHHRDVVVPLLSHGGPWYGPLLLRAIFPRLSQSMRRFMDINEAAAARSKSRVEQALDRVCTELEGRRFLVGGAFSRADLAVAALLAPLCMPAGYGLRWPSRVPEPLNSQIQGFSDRLDWVRQVYATCR